MDIDDELRVAQQAYYAGEHTTAFNKYLVLAEKGHTDSQVFVAWMLYEGVGVQQDWESAVAWYEKAANSNSNEAKFFYARMLTQKREYKKAFEWYKSAADKGDIPSIFRIGYSLVHGKGVKVDLKEGCRYLQQASDNGNIFALRELGSVKFRNSSNLWLKLYGMLLIAKAIVMGVIVAIIDRHSERLRR